MPTRAPRKATWTDSRNATAPTPTATAPTAQAVRTPDRRRFTTARARMVRALPERDRPVAPGRTASRGAPREAVQAGSRPAPEASSTATGAISRTRPREMTRPSHHARASPRTAPATPAASPTAAFSPRTARNSAPRVHPTARRMPISERRLRTVAAAALAPNSALTASTRTNTTTLLASTRRRMLTSTPFLTHRSATTRGGWPYRPAGRRTSTEVGEEPAVMSTARPVSSWMAWATRRTRSRLAGSAPTLPETLTRTTAMGAAGLTPWNERGSKNAPAARRVVSSTGGWARYPPMFMVGSRAPPRRAARLAGLAGTTTGGKYVSRGTAESGPNPGSRAGSNRPTTRSPGVLCTPSTMVAVAGWAVIARYWTSAFSVGAVRYVASWALRHTDRGLVRATAASRSPPTSRYRTEETVRSDSKVPTPGGCAATASSSW